MTEWMRLKRYLLCGLFIMDLSLRSIKTNNWSADNFKKIRHLDELYTWSRGTVRWHWSVHTLFDSCQLTITWNMSIRMSTVKLNTDCILCLGHPASNVTTTNNAWSLQENSRWEGVFCCSHIIMHFDQHNNLNWADCELLLLVILMVFFTKTPGPGS